MRLAGLIFALLSIGNVEIATAAEHDCLASMDARSVAHTARDWPRVLTLSRRILADCTRTEKEWAIGVSGISSALYFMEDYAGSLAEAERCVARVPEDIGCWIDKGGAVEALNREREALGSYQHALSIKPHDDIELRLQKTARERAKRIENSFTVMKNMPDGAKRIQNYISIKGTITTAMAEDFRQLLSEPLQSPIVMVNSAGGSVRAAMAIGELIRSRGLTIINNPFQVCSSACVLLLASGVQRQANGRIGIHRPSFEDDAGFGLLDQQKATELYNQMTGKLRSYLRTMGMADELLAAMLRIPSAKVRYLSPEEVRAFGLDGEDPAWAEWFKASWIAKEGRASYEISQLLLSTLQSCVAVVGKVEECDSEVRPKFQAAVSGCEGTPGRDLVACARGIAEKMTAGYNARR